MTNHQLGAFFFTPATFQNAQKQLHTDLIAFDSEVMANRDVLGESYVRQWKDFINGYGEWYASTSGFTSAIWGSSMDTLEAYRDKYLEFRNVFSVRTGAVPQTVNPAVTGGQPAPGAGEKKTSGWVWALAGAGVLALVGVVAYGYSSYKRQSIVLGRAIAGSRKLPKAFRASRKGMRGYNLEV